MTTTFAFFKKIDGSDRYELTQIVSSPYETESLTEDRMVRDWSKFLDNHSFLSEILESENTFAFSFGTDNSVELHPYVSRIEYENNMDADPDYGINKVIITCNGRKHDINDYSNTAQYFKNLYPSGYTAGDY
jgi:hypothetical protein